MAPLSQTFLLSKLPSLVRAVWSCFPHFEIPLERFSFRSCLLILIPVDWLSSSSQALLFVKFLSCSIGLMLFLKLSIPLSTGLLVVLTFSSFSRPFPAVCYCAINAPLSPQNSSWSTCLVCRTRFSVVLNWSLPGSFESFERVKKCSSCVLVL